MSNQIQATGAVKIRSLTGALTATSGVVSSVPLGGANGVATLDSTGKIPVTQLPSSVMEYKGTWNAATNTPTLANGTGDPGDVYICNVAGTANFGAGPIVFATGDWVVYNGSIWQKSGGGSGLYVPYSGATNDVNLNTKNLFTNNVFEGFSSVAASGVQIVLTVASTPNYLITGSGGQTIKLPDATTLPNGSVYVFNNNQSSGAILVNNNSNTLVVSIPSGGYCNLELIDNSIAAGSWDRHFQAPSNVSWSTNTFDYPGSITSATWNGNTVAINRGGTGATTAITALANLGGTPLTRLISTTAPLLGGGDLTADRTLSITQASTSTNGYLSSTDWNTFNEKTGGSGTLNYVPKFTGIGKTLGNSLIYDNGTNVIIGDTTSSFFFDVNGTARFRSKVTIGDSTISQPGLIIAAGSANQSIQFFNAAGGVSGGGYGVLTVSGTTTSVNYKFSTWNSSNAFYIQDDGNIGIGTPVPNYKLDVSGTGNFTGQLKLGSTITNGTYTYTLPSLTGTLVVSSQITGTANYISKFSSTGLVNSLLWDNGTNVGIGNTNTTYTFDVTGTGRFTGALTLGSTLSSGSLIYTTSTFKTDSSIAFLNVTSGGTPPTSLSNYSQLFFDNYKLLIRKSDNQTITFTYPSSVTSYQYDFPNANGTVALTSQLTGTTNYLPKFTSTGLVNSSISDDGTNISAYTTSLYLYQTSGVGPAFKMTATSTEAQMSSYSSSYRYGKLNFFGAGIDFWSGAVGAYGLSLAMSISNSGTLLVGTSTENSTTYKLQVGGVIQNQLTSGYLLRDGSSTGYGIYKGSTTTIGIAANGSECLTVNSTGNVGIGTSSPSYNLDVTGTGRFTSSLQVANIGIGYAAQSTIGAFIYQSASSGSTSCVIQQDGTGNILQLSGNGAANRLIVTQAGNVGIGTSSPDVKLQIVGGLNNGIKIEPNSSALTLPSSGLSFSTGYNVGYIRNANSSGTTVDLYFEVARVQFGYLGTGIVYSNGGFLTNLNPSDKRLKENITDLKYGLNEILKLRPVSYNWKNDTANQGMQYGFIAQEVQEIMPELINEFKTKENEEDVMRLGLDKEAIFITLVNAIKELEARLKTLENK
jgi:hypothetical protein